MWLIANNYAVYTCLYHAVHRPQSARRVHGVADLGAELRLLEVLNPAFPHCTSLVPYISLEYLKAPYNHALILLQNISVRHGTLISILWVRSGGQRDEVTMPRSHRKSVRARSGVLTSCVAVRCDRHKPVLQSHTLVTLSQLRCAWHF